MDAMPGGAETPDEPAAVRLDDTVAVPVRDLARVLLVLGDAIQSLHSPREARCALAYLTEQADRLTAAMHPLYYGCLYDRLPLVIREAIETSVIRSRALASRRPWLDALAHQVQGYLPAFDLTPEPGPYGHRFGGAPNVAAAGTQTIEVTLLATLDTEDPLLSEHRPAGAREVPLLVPGQAAHATVPLRYRYEDDGRVTLIAAGPPREGDAECFQGLGGTDLPVRPFTLTLHASAASSVTPESLYEELCQLLYGNGFLRVGGTPIWLRTPVGTDDFVEAHRAAGFQYLCSIGNQSWDTDWPIGRTSHYYVGLISYYLYHDPSNREVIVEPQTPVYP